MRWLMLLVLMLAGCRSAADSLTETAVGGQHATAATEIADRRITATYANEQLKITDEFLSTAVRGAQERGLFIIRTLDALGVDTTLAARITPVIVPPTAIPGAEINTNPDSNGAQGGITRIAPTPESRPVTPSRTPDLSITPTIDPALPHLAEVSVSSAVGNNDCATESNTQFDISTPELYAVGRARNFPAGFSVTFTWLRDGQEVYSDTFTWDLEVDDECIWYFVTPEEFEFLPGTYTVTFKNDDTQVALPVTFTLVDPAA